MFLVIYFYIIHNYNDIFKTTGRTGTGTGT